MSAKSLSGREIKKRIYDLLKSPDLDSALDEISLLPRRQVISPLFSFLYDKDQNVKWGAVKAMGTVVAGLANEDMESARVVMRRLMSQGVSAGDRPRPWVKFWRVTMGWQMNMPPF